jgi:hypothetical protein
VTRTAGVVLALAVACCAARAETARADDAPDQKATAQLLFEQGRSAVEQGRFAEACPKFAESQRLDPGIGTQLWLADCYENNGQTASAWVTFKEAAAAAALRHDKREEVARQGASSLEPKLSRLMIVVPEAAALQGLEVRRDGVVLGALEWGAAIPVDPGVHAIAVGAPGRKAWSTTVELPAKPDTLQVTIPALEPAPLPSQESSASGSAAATSPREAPAPSSASPPNRWRTIGLVTGGVGLVVIGVGTVLSFVAKSAYDDSNAGHCHPDNACDPTGLQDRSHGFALATGATVAMIAGAAAVVGGAVLYFTAPGGASNVAIVAGPLGGSARLSIAW